MEIITKLSDVLAQLDKHSDYSVKGVIWYLLTDKKGIRQIKAEQAKRFAVSLFKICPTAIAYVDHKCKSIILEGATLELK